MNSVKALIVGVTTCAVVSCTAPPPAQSTLNANDDLIRWSGRYVEQAGRVKFGYPSVNANLSIDGGTLSMVASSTKPGSLLGIRIDEQPPRRLALTTEPTRYTLIESATRQHQIKISHLSEAWRGLVTIESFALDEGRLSAPPEPAANKLLVIGDSVTCGEGVYTAEAACKTKPREPDSDNSYGMLLGAKLNAETQLVCYGGRGVIRSWNGNTDELQAPDFFALAIPEPGNPPADLSSFVPDVIVVSLGTNDFSLGIGALPGQSEFVGAYVEFARRLLTTYPEAIIALTEGSIVNDKADPSRPQKTVLKRYIANTVEQVANPRLYQIDSPYYPGDECDAHPTGEQHRQIAQSLWIQLKPLLNLKDD
ncbi:GDSL-type esterase/lipase family protein [Gilvimarinus sp. SDUM040013]|uniref:GDSL-type esterase/lipase family protein n=1 Tax=Gilvimarinus gilvus TaxID=3058038 RepID=A0ABU4RV45_9GAMM|nr:SGNH/GDSL hydrolase family protein [Gilvimarinus sp. SDUM040013]MDO3387025.1 GDSL-type esterase/lipase family protein [Gilvimarinus sp. SDUM040013]MDX6848081.1 GDSL-type esterase/lipase family protein [Gilvimarinus sp. SDUM040013]